MKFAYETVAESFSATHGASRRTGADSGDFDFHDRLDPTEATEGTRCPAIGLDGLSFVRLRGCATEACGETLKILCDETAFSRQLLVLFDGELTAIEPSGLGITLRRGDMALVDGRVGLNLRSLQGVDAWIIDVPAPALARWLRCAPTAAVYRLQGDRGWAKVLSAYLRTWEFEPLREVRSAFEKEIIAEHVMSLLSMALTQSVTPRDAQALSARDHGMYAEMRQWVRENYADSEINVSMLASRFGASTRYVHRVFLNAGAGETFLDAVRCERLEAAARRLRTPAKARVTVAEVAAACGFSEPGYFGRVFKGRYGHSPTEFSRKFNGPL